MKEKYIEDIYKAMDSFLVESVDFENKPIIRSVERLNEDRHLFIKRIEKIIQDIKITYKSARKMYLVGFEDGEKNKVEEITKLIKTVGATGTEEEVDKLIEMIKNYPTLSEVENK